MFEHHRESIERARARIAADPEVQALILGGSVAHGFAAAGSDIDVMLVVGEDDYEQRRRDGRLQYFDSEACTYEGGYVDGKFMTESFVARVAERGSEPARFAFADARVLFSRRDGFETLVAAAARYPVEGKTERLQRFYAQLEAWHWYAHEALKWNDAHLLATAVSKLVLFAGRLILAHNQMLYPYHKWFLRVLAAAPEKPTDLIERIAALHRHPTAETAFAVYQSVAEYRTWPSERVWPAQFMLDSELNWLDGHTPIDDV